MTTLNEGGRSGGWSIGYLSRSTDDPPSARSSRTSCAAISAAGTSRPSTRSKDARRTFKVALYLATPAKRALRAANEMADLTTALAARWAPPASAAPAARASLGAGGAGVDRPRPRRRRPRRGHLRLAALAVAEILSTAATPRWSTRPRAREAVRGQAREAGTAPRPTRRLADVRQRHPRVALQVAAVAVGDVEPPIPIGQASWGPQPPGQRREDLLHAIRLSTTRRGARRRGSRDRRPGRCRSRKPGPRTLGERQLRQPRLGE